MSLITVVIPTHNRADLLPEAVRSVLAQTHARLELIVVDDGSTDDTPAVMADLSADTRVRYLRLAQQGGRSAARNHGARAAQGELLGFLDSDDRYLPAALAQHWQVLAAQPELGMTIGGYDTIAADGDATLSQRRPWEEGGSPNRLECWLFNCYATPGAVLLRRPWFERAGGFAADMKMGEDWHFFLKLAQAGCPMAWVPQSVYQYRHHPGGSIATLAAYQAASLRALENLFRAGGLLPRVAALENRARAAVHLMFARKYLAAQQDASAAEALQCSFTLAPQWSRAEKMHLLEFLLSGGSQGEAVPAENLGQRLAPLLAVTPAELRAAQSRVAMAHFFRLRRRASAEARRYLWTGLRLDPRWLANRGVLSFLVRQMPHA